MMTPAQTERLAALLQAMFPDLDPGMILFELDVVTCKHNDKAIVMAAIHHADRWLDKPDIPNQLRQLLSELNEQPSQPT